MRLATMVLLSVLAALQAAAPTARGAPVVVHAVVEDRATRQPIADIAARDFVVTLDGVPAAGLSATCGVPPLTLVVVIDITSSVEVQMRANNAMIRKAAERLLATVREGDRVRIGAVAATPSISQVFTADRGQMADAVREVLDRKDGERYGTSPIWDAVDLAITALEPEPGRRAIILFTDGRSSGNRLGYTEMATHAVTTGVAINVVSPFEPTVIPQSGTVMARVRPQTPLGQLANVTGGVLLTEVPEWRQHPDKVLLTVLPRIRTSCEISLTPPMADGTLHRLEVRVSRPGAVTHAPQLVLAPK